MKKFIITLLMLMLCVSTALFTASCGEDQESSSAPESIVESNTESVIESESTAESESFFESERESVFESESESTTESEIVDDQSFIEFKTLTVDGLTAYGKVSNATVDFSFIEELNVVGGADFIVALDSYGTQTVITKKVPLAEGDNTFYVFETTGGKLVKTYVVTIRRRPMYEVTFNTDGGSAVATQYVEEDFLATQPTTEKLGYDFVSWNYNFNEPITRDTAIVASWSAHTDTKYTVNYYLQNLDDNNYTLHETVELKGETDTTATAEIKTFEHFTYNRNKSTVSGNISGDGSRILSVYYTRNVYTLSVNNSALGSITNTGNYKYGTDAFTTTATPPNLGYDFLGWYSGEVLLTSDLTYTFTATQDVTAKFAVKAEMANFNFTSTLTACSITGIKDKSVTQIIIPDFVTSIGDSAFRNCSSLTEITLPFVGASKSGTSNTHFGYIFGASSSSYNNSYVPSSLKKVTITGGSIGEYAFYYCSSLTSVVIGDSVTSIGDYAFRNCSKMTSVVIGDGVTSICSYAFYNCSNLTSVVIPDSVTSIGNSAFSSCSNLTSIVIGNSVTSIGDSAFRGCSSLTEITLPFVGASKNATGYQSVFGYIFGYTTITSYLTISGATYQYWESSSSSSYTYYHYYIPTSLKKVTITGGTSIGEYAFYHCSSLTSVVIPDSVTSIGNRAFSGCSSLTSVYITDITAWCKISGLYYLMYGTSSKKLYLNNELITDLVIPDSVTSIGNYAFAWCNSLTSITIPDSVTSIGNSAFYDCSSLTSIEVSKNNTAYKSIDGNLYSKDGKTFIQYAIGKTDSEFIIPDSVTNIGDSFRNCSSLTSVVIGESVTSIGSDAFYNCSSLNSITFKDTSTWYRTTSSTNWQNKTGGTETNVTNSSTNATYFTSTYDYYYWYKL